MAKMIDQKPSYHGEAKVWDALSSFLPNTVVVYNNREINGREFDYCLFIENIGVIIIEVKGWLKEKINVLGVDNIVIEGYEKPQRSPKRQARAYRFGLLNKIVEKHSVSPLIFDMVCYPFISKAEYLTAHMDIISEEQFTIFKEDIESQELLLNKIKLAYDASKGIPHAEFSPELMIQLRQDWEPNFNEEINTTEDVSKPYSILSIYPDPLNEAELRQIIKEYFDGTKRIVFVGNQEAYTKLSDCLNDAFAKYNVQPGGNKLCVGYKGGFKIETKSFRVFNMEVYFVNDISSITTEPLSIIEGACDEENACLLQRLANVTQFNYQQYQVEHAPAQNNTLVEAGAGTGKTFSMVSRVAFLCNKKSNAISNIADEIAMVTFTNDAANNMKVRLKQMFVNYFILTGKPRFLKFVEDIDRAHISTIHSFALDILRGEALYTGLGTNFRISSNEYLRAQIYDTYLSDFLGKMEVQNQNFINEIPVPIYDLKKKIMMVADRLLAKSVDLKGIKLSEMGVTTDNTVPYFNQLIEEVIIPAEQKYSENSHLSNALDLKECISFLESVLKQIPGKLDSLKFRYMFIDEFQDTDDVQIEVFRKLQKVINSECRLFVVGDLKQSIYRFRGARLSAFTQLVNNSLFAWDKFHLTINYRTDRRLLEKFDEIFSSLGTQTYLPYIKNLDCLTSSVQTDIEDEDLFVAVPCHAKDEEKRHEVFLDVLMKQKKMLSSIMKSRADANLEPLSKEERTIAILVRNNWQVDNLVNAGKKKGIKINTKSGGDLFQLDSTIDLYKLVLALSNSSNPVHMINLIESNYTSLKLDYQNYHGMKSDECYKDLKRILDEFFMVRMNMTWHQVVNEAYTQPILYVLKHLYDALQPWKKYSYQSTEQRYYMANYEYLIERIIKYSRVDTLTLNQVVEYLKINILTGQQQLSRDIEVEGDDIQLLCTTIHKSKGLEFGTVILPYTDEDISDPKKAKLDANYSGNKLSYTVLFENKVREHNSNYDEKTEIDEQIAEESRILYVALTRAIRNCVWIHNLDSKPAISWGSFMEV